MRRHHDREMRIGIAGLLAGAFVTAGVHDVVMSRSAGASDLGFGGAVHHAVAEILGLPSLGEDSTAGLVIRVLGDIVEVVAGGDEEDEKE